VSTNKSDLLKGGKLLDKKFQIWLLSWT